MTRKTVADAMEWIRPVGIGVVVFCAFYAGHDPVARFHILGPWVVMLMSGSVAFEGLVLGEAASVKIGYQPQRAYQIQSALANAATALTALLVYALHWGRYADATIVTAMLLFFALSAANHVRTAVVERNLKPVNLLRPILVTALIVFLVPPMIQALAR